MKIEDLEKDIALFRNKAPQVYNDVIKIGIPLEMLHSIFIQSGNEALKEFDLLRSELDVLSSLYFSGGNNYTLSPTQLYDRLLFSSGGMTKVLKRLEDKNFILRICNPNDKRSKLVKLNKKKENTILKAIKRSLIREEECLINLNKKEKDQLQKLLIKALLKKDS